MQLERLVRFHKALADPTRVRIVALLAKGPLHGQAIAGKLGLSAPTVTHHMAKLREAGLIRDHREKNTIYFSLEEQTLVSDAGSIVKLVKGVDHTVLNQDMDGGSDVARQAVIRNFFTLDGRLKHLPAQRKKRRWVLEHLIRGLKPGIKYPEQEINQYIQTFHEDYATIRREFIIQQYMYRDNGIYELNPPELWNTSD